MFFLEVCTSRLIALRKTRKYSQAQIGNLINLSKQAVNEIEKGRSKISLENACILADFYEISLDYLVGRTDIKEMTAAPPEKPLAPEEKLIIESFRQLDDMSKGQLIERSQFLLEKSKHQTFNDKKNA